MMRGMRHLLRLVPSALLAFVLALGVDRPAWAGEIAFVPLRPGLELATLRVAPPDGDPDPVIHILRVDPKRFDLTLVTAKARKEDVATAREWARRAGLIAAINPSMYQTDHRTSVSLMVGNGVVNNPRLSKDNTVLAFDRVKGRAGARIIDRTCEPFEKLRPQYTSFVQSIRMIDCQRRNVWALQDKTYSHAVVGADSEGRILLIHTRATWRTHDFVDALLGMPIGLTRLQYAEGGAPAQLYLKAGGVELDRFGESRPGFLGPQPAIPIPNVLGIIPRKR